MKDADTLIHSARIVLIDDNPMNIRVLETLLAEQGFRDLRTILDPREALTVGAQAGEPLPDLVLLDIRMPHISGFEVLEHLMTLAREQRDFLPVIILTAYSDEQSRLRALAQGAHDFLGKPFDSGEVMHRIRNALWTRMLFRERRDQAQALENLVEKRTRELVHLASHDPITGLPNRTALRAALLRRLEQKQRGALVYISLDRLEAINDALGHAFGERVLRRVALALSETVPPGVLCGAWGGSDFLMVAGATGFKALITGIVDLFSRPFVLDGAEVVLECHIGSCRFPADGDEPDRLIQRAGLAVFVARQKDVPHTTFNTGLERAAGARLVLERELRHAIERNQLQVVYQPKISLQDRSVIGVEALLRWTHPDYGPIPPITFIPVAEETGAIVEIGTWVLHHACTDIAALCARVGVCLSVAVNVSGRQFEAPDLPGTVAEAVRASGLSPQALEVEITETAMMRDMDRTRNVLNGLRDLGVSVAIDDFGTGYSSLAYLRQLPINTLKIDKSFIQQLAESADDRAITLTIIGMANSLSLTVVAEGVETEDHVEFLQTIGCQIGQGYVFARPMPLADLEQFLATWP